MTRDGAVYADTGFLRGLRLANPAWRLGHLGFGDFALVCDTGEVRFTRMCGTGIEIEGASGRTHRVTGPPELVAEIVSAMEAAGQSAAVAG